jgi:hypothetical protein
VGGSGPRAGESVDDATRPAPAGRGRRLRYDAEAIDLVAETLGVAVGLAPFRLPGAAVYQLLGPGEQGRPAAMLTLWPSLRRVDAINGAATVVFTDVATVDLVTDVEVQFRRATTEYLIVARGGKIIVRS